jgi:hypothetical protein
MERGIGLGVPDSLSDERAPPRTRLPVLTTLLLESGHTARPMISFRTNGAAAAHVGERVSTGTNLAVIPRDGRAFAAGVDHALARPRARARLMPSTHGARREGRAPWLV